MTVCAFAAEEMDKKKKRWTALDSFISLQGPTGPDGPKGYPGEDGDKVTLDHI